VDRTDDGGDVNSWLVDRTDDGRNVNSWVSGQNR
jgi:hypothetical protein